AALALDCIAAVARVPLEGVVPLAQENRIVALIAVDEVVTVPAEQDVVAVAAQESIVARSTIDGDLDERGQIPRGAEGVVAAVAVEHEVLAGADVQRERRRAEAIEADAGSVGGGSEHLGAVATVNLHRIDPAAALVEISVVTGVPYDSVVARFAEDLVIAVTARQRVVV